MGLFDRILKGADEAPAGTPDGGVSTGASAAPYDEVTAPGPDGALERMTKRQFEDLPLEKRIRLLVQGTLRFYRSGQEVRAAQAMRTAY